MKKVFAAVIVALPLLGLTFFLLVQRNSTVYATDSVKVVAVGLNEDGLRLHFQPPIEAGYYCPGVRFKREGSSIHYEYVRSRVDKKVPVDSPATTDQRGALCVTFPYHAGKWELGDQIVLIDSRGKPVANITRSR
ncbi:MAG TPA: hypothetical protein VFG04_03385 [Planctomycetaceae bacterium]|nr:hypothetical protein [Planctomycetaceae bacterium]